MELEEVGRVLDAFRREYDNRNITWANSATADRYADEPVRICGITAILGTYEQTVKEPLNPLSPSCPMFVVTDRDDLMDSRNDTSAWTYIRVNSSLWSEDCVRPDFVGAKNNPCERPFLFNVAKFYKMQFHRVPEVMDAGCNVVVWFDGTIQIRDGTFMGRLAHRASRGQNYLVYVSDGKPSIKMGLRDGLLSSEVSRSLTGKYGGKQSHVFGPRQHVDQQYEYYLSQGFQEKWFQNETWFDEHKGVESNKMKYGVYVTCMIMFDIRKRETREFLDCWWEENVLRSTQDQVGFPYCAWKLKAKVWALPDEEDPGKWPDGWVANNRNFFKREHGT